MIVKLLLSIIHFAYKMYGYEALNIFFSFMPSSWIVTILRHYGASIGERVRIQPPFIVHNADQKQPIYTNLTIGDDCYLGRHVLIDLQGKVVIESNCTISHHVLLNTHTNVGKSPLSEKIIPTSEGNIILRKGSYIGLRSTVLQGVTIGENSAIGACSLVTQSIPSHVLAFGTPCKVKKEFNV